MLRTARRAPASRASRTRPLPLVLALLLLGTGLVGAAPATALPATAPTVGASAAGTSSLQLGNPAAVSTQAAEFSDVPPDHSYYTEISWLAAAGIGTGYRDGEYKPLNPVTRQAVAGLFYRFSGSPAFTPWRQPKFSDVPTGHAAYTEISWLAYTGIGTGYSNGEFRPRTAVTRQSMAAFLYRLAGSPSYTPPSTPEFSDVPRGHTYYKAISWLADTGVDGGSTWLAGSSGADGGPGLSGCALDCGKLGAAPCAGSVANEVSGRTEPST